MNFTLVDVADARIEAEDFICSSSLPSSAQGSSKPTMSLTWVCAAETKSTTSLVHLALTHSPGSESNIRSQNSARRSRQPADALISRTLLSPTLKSRTFNMAKISGESRSSFPLINHLSSGIFKTPVWTHYRSCFFVSLPIVDWNSQPS